MGQGVVVCRPCHGHTPAFAGRRPGSWATPRPAGRAWNLFLISCNTRTKGRILRMYR